MNIYEYRECSLYANLLNTYLGTAVNISALNLWPLVASDILVQLGQWDGTRDIVCGVSYCRRARTLA
ncbi:hypothetical protein ACS0PU_010006 [Formica fusca]